MLVAALAIYNGARFEWGWLPQPTFVPASYVGPTLVLAGYWVLCFFFFGLYQSRYAESRFDELISLAKVVTLGVLILFFILFIDKLDYYSARQTLLVLWMAVFVCVAAGRITVRSIQKALILKGYGRHNTLVVGWSDRVEELYEEVARYPAAGLNIVGAIRLSRDGRGDGSFLEPLSLEVGDGETAVLTPALAPTHATEIEALPALIQELNIQDVLIALGSDDHKPLFDVLRLSEGQPVSLKLVPDFYQVIGGMARTEQIYGLPLIEVLPQPMPAWEQSTKRLVDFFVALILLVVGLPVWLLVGFLVRLSSPGPAIYRQTRVGKQGKTFTMLKFRTMRQDAEAATGPVWAQADDPRYTPIGRWLRKTRLDEIPQLWNVFKGDMSLVGPRPERPYFVEKLKAEIPLYSRRHRVKPGITGWAQVKWKYDTSLEDVKQKVKYDLFYIENMSLRMDLKILLSTIRTALKGSGQ
ncbi:MAG: undecaprenyl-phosphate glucose phosphotransferase [Rhodothermales bacterium]